MLLGLAESAQASMGTVGARLDLRVVAFAIGGLADSVARIGHREVAVTGVIGLQTTGCVAKVIVDARAVDAGFPLPAVDCVFDLREVAGAAVGVAYPAAAIRDEVSLVAVVFGLLTGHVLADAARFLGMGLVVGVVAAGAECRERQGDEEKQVNLRYFSC